VIISASGTDDCVVTRTFAKKRADDAVTVAVPASPVLLLMRLTEAHQRRCLPPAEEQTLSAIAPEQHRRNLRARDRAHRVCPTCLAFLSKVLADGNKTSIGGCHKSVAHDDRDNGPRQPWVRIIALSASAFTQGGAYPMSAPLRRARSRALVLTDLIESRKRRRRPIAATADMTGPMLSEISQTLLGESQKLFWMARKCGAKQIAVKLYEISDTLLEMAHGHLSPSAQ
jgi:hypothetical protein